MLVSVDWGRERERAVLTPDMEECVLDNVDRSTSVIMTQVEEELNVLHLAIWRILHDQLLYPYHLREQGLMSELLSVSCSTKC
jgi:hypothetical protein